MFQPSRESRTNPISVLPIHCREPTNFSSLSPMSTRHWNIKFLKILSFYTKKRIWYSRNFSFAQAIQISTCWICLWLGTASSVYPFSRYQLQIDCRLLYAQPQPAKQFRRSPNIALSTMYLNRPCCLGDSGDSRRGLSPDRVGRGICLEISILFHHWSKKIGKTSNELIILFVWMRIGFLEYTKKNSYN